eukprot:s884_g34.t1
MALSMGCTPKDGNFTRDDDMRGSRGAAKSFEEAEVTPVIPLFTFDGLDFDGDRIVNLREKPYYFEEQFGGAMSISFIARWDAFALRSRIIDFGDGATADNIIIANLETGRSLIVEVFRGPSKKRLTMPGCLALGETHRYLLSISESGLMRMLQDGSQLGVQPQGYAPRSVERRKLLVGGSNWSSVLRLKKGWRGPGFNQATGGFPCQGFSLQGDCLGLDDHRSHGLFFILQGAWFLQVDGVLLECVGNVINFPAAQRCIEHFAEQTGMTVVKLIFDLQDQWPVRRNRFWCHLLRKDIPCIQIPRWPISSDFQTLGDIMPLDAIWSPQDEAQLEWNPSELALYLDSSFGTDQ